MKITNRLTRERMNLDNAIPPNEPSQSILVVDSISSLFMRAMLNDLARKFPPKKKKKNGVHGL